MADSKISGLPAKSTPVGTDTTVIVDSADFLNKKITLDDLPTTSAVQSAINGKVEKSGDTMTGALEIAGLSENIQFSVNGLNATANLNLKTDDDSTRPTGDVLIKSGNAVNSDYAGSIYLEGGSNVDGNPANIQITAGVSSGTGANGSIILDAKNIVYLNQNAAGSITASNHKLEDVADPTAPQDAATRNWVESVSAENGTLFVDSTASLSGADGSALKPFVTLADAMAVAVDNDVIVVRPGTYSEIPVVIPPTINFLTIKGQSSGSTTIQNGFNYTPSNPASIEINFYNLSLGQLTVDATLAANGIVNVKNCVANVDRIDSNAAVLSNFFDSTIAGGSCYSTAIFSQCLIVGNPNMYAPLVIFDSCRFVTYVIIHDTAKIRILNSQVLNGIYFAFGIANTATPEVEIDIISDALGIFFGTLTKTNVGTITGYLKEDVGGTITGPVEINNLPASPFSQDNLTLSQGDIGGNSAFIKLQKTLLPGSTNFSNFYGIQNSYNCFEAGIANSIFLLDSSINVADLLGDCVYHLYSTTINGNMNGYYCNFEVNFYVDTNTNGTWEYYSRYTCNTHNSTLNGFDFAANVTDMDGNASGINFTINTGNYISGDVKIFDTDSNITFSGAGVSKFTGVYIRPTVVGTPASTTGGLFDMSDCSGGTIKALKTVGDSEFTGNLLNTGDIEATGAIKGQLNMQGAAPTASNDPGVPGDMRFDSTDLYVCVAANTWKKVTLSTF